MEKNYRVVGLAYPSFYIKEYAKAVAFYTEVFGEPSTNLERIKGWKLGNTWLTLFPSADQGADPDSNPVNAEFAVEVSRPEEVDLLWAAMVAAGASPGWEAEDTEMYERMRFAYVDDPVGIRIDIYCPLPPEGEK